MKRKDVREKLEKLLYYMRQEQELRDQVASLEFIGPEKRVQDAMKQETDLLKAVETLRQEKMLPLVEEMAAFVSLKKAALSAPPAAAASAGGTIKTAAAAKAKAPPPKRPVGKK